MDSKARLTRFESYLPFASCVPLGKLCNLSVSQFSDLQHGDKKENRLLLLQKDEMS